jgi:hypothetical protein
MNAAEDRLSALMDAATRALAPPVESILAEGERLGRRRRRRRRAAIATGTAALVLVGGIGTVAGVRLARTDHQQNPNLGAAAVVQHASRAPTSASPAATAAPSQVLPATPTAPSTDGVQPINSQTAVELLRLNGAAGWKFGSYNPYNQRTASLLNVDVDDGQGLARIFIAIGSTAKSGMDPADCSLQAKMLQDVKARPIGAPPASCTVRTLPNGDKVMQEVLRADQYGQYQYRVVAYRADGVAMEITAANGDVQKSGTELTRVTPPLSLPQWTAIALDRSWQLVVPYTNTPSPSPPASPTS